MSKATDKAIVCTLSPMALAPRLAEIRSLTHRHLRAHRFEGRTLQLIYDLAALDELRRIVSLEQECCAFLDFDIRANADSVELLIVGPEQAGGDTTWLFSQFLPIPPTTAGSACACCSG